MESIAVMQYHADQKTRPDTRLPQSRAGGQEQCRRAFYGVTSNPVTRKDMRASRKVFEEEEGEEKEKEEKKEEEEEEEEEEEQGQVGQ